MLRIFYSQNNFFKQIIHTSEKVSSICINIKKSTFIIQLDMFDRSAYLRITIYIYMIIYYSIKAQHLIVHK